MSIIGFIADVHLGNHKLHGGAVRTSLNTRCLLALRALERAVALAAVKGCADLFVLGDLFDYARPEAPLLAHVQRIFQKHAGLRVHVLSGNHDLTSSALGDNALGPLAPVARVIERPYGFQVSDVRVYAIPFAIEGLSAHSLRGELERINNDFDLDDDFLTPRHRILGLHVGVSDDRTAPWLLEAEDSLDVGVIKEVAAQFDIDHVFAGNWHDRRTWPADELSDVNVYQLGALVPTGWDNPGLDGYGTLAMWQGGDVVLHSVPGPRFVFATFENLNQVAKDSAGLDGRDLFVRLKVKPDEIAVGRTALESLGVAGDVQADTSEANIAARMAASMAKSASTLDEALSNFVAEMMLPEHVSRTFVLQEAKRFLGSE